MKIAKLPTTIYNAEIKDALNRGVHELPYGIMIRSFMECGYGKEKAQKWVDEMVKINDHENKNGIIKF